jgi:hypothetical protein
MKRITKNGKEPLSNVSKTYSAVPEASGLFHIVGKF